MGHRMLGLYLLCLGSVVSTSFGQGDSMELIRFHFEDGLSDNQVTCIAQDEWGYLWIGTGNGLNRFDGIRFEKFYPDSPKDFLRSAHILKLIQMPGHRLGIATRMGAYILNTRDYSVRTYIVPDSTSFMKYRNSVWDLKELNDRSIAVTTAAGFYVFSPAGEILFRKDAFGPDDMLNTRILYGRSMLSLPGDKLIVYINAYEQAMYDHERRSFREFTATDTDYSVFAHPPVPGWIASTQVGETEYVFCPGTDSLIYYDLRRALRVASPLPFHYADEFHRGVQFHVITDSLLLLNSWYSGYFMFQLDRKSGSISMAGPECLPGSKLRCAFIDKQQQLWFGNEQGLFRFRSRTEWIRKYDFSPALLSLEDDNPASEEGGFYIGAVRHGDKLYLARHDMAHGLVIADRRSMRLEKVFSFFNRSGSYNLGYSVQMYLPDTLWLGTEDGLLWFDMQSQTYGAVQHDGPPQFADLNILTSGRCGRQVWIGAYMRGMAADYNPATRSIRMFDALSDPPIPFSKLKHLVCDSEGNVWFGGHGLARFNRQTQQFDTLITVYGGPNKFDDDIVSMHADNHGSLWIHNATNGLLRYDIQARTWTHFGPAEGIPILTFLAMSPVIDEKIWIATANQLMRFDTRTFRSEVFGSQDGYTDVAPKSEEMYFDSAGRELYLFAGDKIVVIPVDTTFADTISRELFFEQINVHDGPVIHFPQSGLVFSARDNNLLIPFTVIDFQDSEQYTFAYRIQGRQEWIDLGDRRSVDLIGLSPGAYHLEVRGQPRKGEPFTREISFVIRPPLWRSPLAVAGYVLVFAGCMYLIYRWRIARIHEKANLDRHLSQTEMKALHAQMNPHFVFNSLNSIREMILNNENMQASRYLGNFAHLIRMTLHQSRQNTISLRETMDYLQRYVQMEQIRSADFTFQMYLSPAVHADETALPPMLIQPFIENAIWHGLDGQDGQIDILVRFDCRDDQLICTIEDNGVGIHQSMNGRNVEVPAHRSVSIANIRDRISLLNQKHRLQSTLRIEDIGELTGFRQTGTRITLTLPLEIQEV